MDTYRRRCMLAALAACAAPGAFAQAWPDRPVTLYCPFAAGGGIADANARLVAQKLGALIGQSVVVDNRPGAGGNIALSIAARAEPDGYSLMFGTNGTHAANIALYKDLRFHPLRDFVPVHGLFSDFNLLVTGNGTPYASFAEFLDYARRHPGTVTYASAGTGTAQHLVAEQLQSVAGIRMTHVTYKGAGPALNDLMAGIVDVLFDYPISSIPLVQAGKLRPLVSTGKARLALLPTVPTIAQQGYPGGESSVWSGLFAPARTPPAIVARLSAAVDRILADPEVRARAEKNGTVLMTAYDAARFPAFVGTEIERWKRIVDKAGVML